MFRKNQIFSKYDNIVKHVNIHSIVPLCDRHYGCIKAGSCGSECQNSLAGHLQGGRKWNKDPKTLRALVLQHLWSFWDIAEIMM